MFEKLLKLIYIYISFVLEKNKFDQKVWEEFLVRTLVKRTLVTQTRPVERSRIYRHEDFFFRKQVPVNNPRLGPGRVGVSFHRVASYVVIRVNICDHLEAVMLGINAGCYRSRSATKGLLTA